MTPYVNVCVRQLFVRRPLCAQPPRQRNLCWTESTAAAAAAVAFAVEARARWLQTMQFRATITHENMYAHTHAHKPDFPPDAIISAPAKWAAKLATTTTTTTTLVLARRHVTHTIGTTRRRTGAWLRLRYRRTTPDACVRACTTCTHWANDDDVRCNNISGHDDMPAPALRSYCNLGRLSCSTCNMRACLTGTLLQLL